jgi:hypothetical protein
LERFRYIVVDAFFAEAAAMRKQIDRRLGDRTDPFDPARFAWEHWHVPGQFSQLRTPARGFFSSDLARAFEARLLRWAGVALGVSLLGGPPWLSAIVDGGFQGVHRDSPNGQLAFTYGLGRGRFAGGDTLLARDALLDYFRSGAHADDAADTPLFDEVPPRFDRLVVFDSRLPHAVRTVEGPRRAKDGRIAVQGWLAAAGCVVDGPLEPEEATRAANAALARVPAMRGVEGLAAIRLETGKDGRVKRAVPLASTLVDVARGAPDAAVGRIVRALARARFPAGSARIVAPAIVRRGRARVPPCPPKGDVA